MKRNPGIASVIFLLMILVSCKKTNTPPTISEPTRITDARNILIKEVMVEKLPPPYFHFNYNDSNFVTAISFADGLLRYNLAYENKRIQLMTNAVNGNKLSYAYTNNRVSAIRMLSSLNGQPKWRFDFTYYENSNLKQMRWFRFLDNPLDSVLMRKVIMIYYADGNLAEFDELRDDGHYDLAWVRTVEFQNYDNGINVDDFYLLKDFFDEVLFLPQIKLQKNNPRLVISKGIANDYRYNYSYQYNNNQLPLKKTLDMVQTRGNGSGEHNTFTEEFSYY